MSATSASVRRRVRVALIASLFLVAGWSATVAQAPSPSTVGSPGVSVVAPSPDPADGAILLVPDSTNFGGQPTPRDHITVGPDGKTLMIYFYAGVDGCYGLKTVTVSVVDGVTSITLETGRRQDAMGKMCIQGLQLYKTPMLLDTSILGGGATS